jgi:hypothetical protein
MQSPRRLPLRSATLLVMFAGSCALFPKAPPPEVGDYALGMTYREARSVGGDFKSGHRPPGAAWGPTAVRVKPPEGAEDMRLVFVGECITTIETIYPGACEDRLIEFASHSYGPVSPDAHGAHAWTDGVREVVMVTRHDGRAACEPTCVTSCAVTYRLAPSGQLGGPANATEGRGACRAMGRRARTRWRDDSLHTIQRHILDETGFLVGAGTEPMKAP